MKAFVMLEASGYQNDGGHYRTGQSIFEMRVAVALKDVGWGYGRFVARGGLYDW